MIAATSASTKVFQTGGCQKVKGESSIANKDSYSNNQSQKIVKPVDAIVICNLIKNA